MTITSRKPLDETDPVVLQLLQLAAEVILTYPGAVPPDLYDLCDTWAGDLAAAVNPTGTAQRDQRTPGEPAPRAQDVTAGAVPADDAAAPDGPGAAASPGTSVPAERETAGSPDRAS